MAKAEGCTDANKPTGNGRFSEAVNGMPCVLFATCQLFLSFTPINVYWGKAAVLFHGRFDGLVRHCIAL